MIPIRNAVPSRYPPVVTWILIATNCLVFLFQDSLSPDELELFLRQFGLMMTSPISSLGGQVQYINPAGLQLLGHAALDDALRLHVLDFVSPESRSIVQDELWRRVLRNRSLEG